MSAPPDLAYHLCIGYSRFAEAVQWVFESEHSRHVADVDRTIKLDDADAMQAAVRQGLGILPLWLVSPLVATGDLEIVMPDHTVPSLPIHAVYTEPRTLSLRARRFLDLLIDRRTIFEIAAPAAET